MGILVGNAYSFGILFGAFEGLGAGLSSVECTTVLNEITLLGKCCTMGIGI